VRKSGESTLLFTATGSFSGAQGIGVWRKPAAGGAFKSSGGNFVFISGRNYRWNHADLQANMVFFLNKFMGEQAPTGVANVTGIPLSYSLSQNYPNPFNPSTTIRYQLPKAARVSLKIFNVLGQEIASLVDGKMDTGYHQVQWNATVPSGIYFYRLQAGDFVGTKKMVVVK
jgi:hypothetical protein